MATYGDPVGRLYLDGELNWRAKEKVVQLDMRGIIGRNLEDFAGVNSFSTVSLTTSGFIIEC